MAARFDDQLRQRLLAFQRHHGLDEHGRTCAQTWAKLTDGARSGNDVDARLAHIVADVRTLAAVTLPPALAASFAPLRGHLDAGMAELDTAATRERTRDLVAAFTRDRTAPLVEAASVAISPGAAVVPPLESVLSRLLPTATELLAPFLPEILIVLVVVLVILWVILQFSGPDNRPDIQWLPAPAPAPASTPRPADPPVSGPRDRRTPRNHREPEPEPGPGPRPTPRLPEPERECVPWHGEAEAPRVRQDYLDRIGDTWEAIQAEERRSPGSRTRTGVSGFLVARVHCEQANAACVAVVDANNCVLAKAYGQFWKGRAPDQHAEQEAIRQLDGAPLPATARRIKIVCTKEPCPNCLVRIAEFTAAHGLARYDEGMDFTKVNKGSYPIREANAAMGL
jgi:hypothetical protein